MQQQIFGFLISCIGECTFFLMFYISMHKQVDRKTIFLATLFMGIVGMITMTPVNELYRVISQTYHISAVFLVNMVNALFNLPLLYYFSPKKFKSGIFHGACCYYIWQACCMYLSSSINYILWIFFDRYSTIFLVLSTLLLLPFSILSIYLIKKINIYEFSQYLRIEERPFWQIGILSLSIISIVFLIDMLRYLKDVDSVYYLSLALILLAVFSIVMKITADYMHHKEKETLHDVLLSQQTLYIQNLEDIQKEMRLYKHDFQNMLSGIYLHSQNGDSTEVQKTIQNLWDDFDEGIGIKMHMTNQLANIKIMEVRSLLMKKLTKIHEKQIEFYLEVLYPITNVHMKTNDLTRCLGILLDNAIEEVSQYGGHITCMMVQEQKETTFVIENTIAHPIEIECIWDSGYSTKGEHRGLGLESYQKIVDKYENVTMSTTYENQVFIQELRIGVMV